MTIYKPLRSPMPVDIMIGNRFYRSIKLRVTVGLKYDEADLKILARLTLPSLQNKDFSLIPTDNPVYKS